MFGVLKKMLVVHKLSHDACVEITVLISLKTVLNGSLVGSSPAKTAPEMCACQGKSRAPCLLWAAPCAFVSYPHWSQKGWIMNKLIKANLKQNIFKNEVNGSSVGKRSHFWIFPWIEN